MAKISKSKENAIGLVIELVDAIEQIRNADKRTTKELIKLLRQGCAYTINGGNAEWENLIGYFPGLDTGEALLLLSNELVGYDDRYSLDDVTKEFS